jgi:hypothetical protein
VEQQNTRRKETEMKVRTNRKKILRKLRHNKTITWFLAPILASSAKLKEKNESDGVATPSPSPSTKKKWLKKMVI